MNLLVVMCGLLSSLAFNNVKCLCSMVICESLSCTLQVIGWISTCLYILISFYGFNFGRWLALNSFNIQSIDSFDGFNFGRWFALIYQSTNKNWVFLIILFVVS